MSSVAISAAGSTIRSVNQPAAGTIRPMSDLILIPLTLAAAVAAWLLACWAFGFIEALTYLTVILLAVVTLYGAMRGHRGRA